ncbi:MAG TPA: C1 family peptidase [Flavobacteriales bacterium]|nr:C1 family peptidase [Flavobacteriales bacterium]
MPIRMTDDQNDRRSSQRPSGGGGMRGGGGGGGILGALAPMLINLLIKKPKLLIVVLIVGAVFYFMSGSEGCAGGGGNIASQVLQMATGANFSPELYDKTEVFEPLADNVNSPLPEKVSLQQFAPQRRNQGQQGSCVAWASAYAARTIVQAQATEQAPDQAAFSPSYLYNQIKIENSDCQGSYIQRAMEYMQDGGVLPFSQFAYTDEGCSKQPSAEEKQRAQAFRIKGYQRLSSGDAPDSPTDMLAMKQQLAQGSPVVIGMMVGGSFMQDMAGQEEWTPNADDYNMRGFGGHAMCVIGYDDFKFGKKGGFQIMNSWGPDWGKNGIAWMTYEDFAYFNKEAYAVYPQGKGVDVKPSTFNISFGLQLVDAKGIPTGEHIALRNTGGRTFRTEQPVPKGTRFKVEVTNNSECYLYCFGEETDGSTYILFPNTEKHSPYCGITGTRLFPSDQSMTIDDVGTTDVMAIIVYNQAVDFKKIDQALKASSANGLDGRLTATMGNELLDPASLQYTQGATFGVSGPADRAAMAVVIEIEKR